MPLRPRVVYLNSVAKLSGAELALLRTLPPLLEHLHATVVLAEDGPLAPRLRDIGATVIVLPLHERVRGANRGTVTPGGLDPSTVVVLVRYVWRLRQLIRSLDADLVHTNNLKSALYGGFAGRLAGRKVVWHVRDRIADDYLPRPAVLLVRLLSRVLPSAVIANSQATLSTLPARRRQAVLGSPVVPDSVTGTAPAAAGTHEGVVIGLIGRISPWKGQDVLLRAFAQAFAGSDARLRLVGSAMFGEEEFEASLHELASTLGIAEQVEFRGFRDDVWAELAALDIAVHASTVPEPFGQVVLEAMASGVPIVAAAEGGPAEVVTDGVDGVLVAPRDPAVLAAALQRLAGDPELRASLAAAGRVTAAAYSPARTAEGVLAVYRTLLGEDFAP